MVLKIYTHVVSKIISSLLTLFIIYLFGTRVDIYANFNSNLNFSLASLDRK